MLNTMDRRNFVMFLTERLAALAHVRSVRVKEISSTQSARSLQPVRTRDYVAFSVPVRDEGRQVILEAAFDARVGIDEWTCQLLEAAASLAGLLLETERLATTPMPLLPAVRDGAAPLIGSSEVMRLLRERVERVANTNFTVLIEGESGVGKELVARQIHELGPRRQGPFVAINCAALVETLIEAELFGIEERTATGVRGRRGKFEHADGGTLFLDEISDLSIAAQAKLLRVVQDLTVERVGGASGRLIDTRIVAATNRPLQHLVDRGLFRTDLFYRLSGVEIRVPPLRLRKSDIIELTQYFLARHEGRGRVTMTPAALDALVAYDWPGNVRELERMIEGAIATAESQKVRVDDLPVSLRGEYGEHLLPSCQLGDTMRAWGSRYARLILEKHGGNKRQACQALDISYHTLNSYLNYRPPAPPPISASPEARELVAQE
jgi:transcriptional regulator with PAS, ATPase and Fis domain